MIGLDWKLTVCGWRWEGEGKETVGVGMVSSKNPETAFPYK